jgi:hypothetical protein
MFKKNIILLICVLNTTHILFSANQEFRRLLPVRQNKKPTTQIEPPIKFHYNFSYQSTPLEINFWAQVFLREQLILSKINTNIFKLDDKTLIEYLTEREQLKRLLRIKQEERKKYLSSTDKF